MKTSERILNLLEERLGDFFSGEEIAQKLGISRSAVWKGIQVLRQNGYSIRAFTKRGYSLSPETDVLSVMGIRKLLVPELAAIRMTLFDSVGSTNALLRQHVQPDTSSWTVFLAHEQTAGRAKLGNSFFSPRGTGLYLSLFIRPEHCPLSQVIYLSAGAALAVCRAIESVSGEEAEIKWVNDIYVRGKKVCGILTEGDVRIEEGGLDYAIIGVGINVYKPVEGFPSSLKSDVSFLFDQTRPGGKNRLAAAFLNSFFHYESIQERNKIVREYRHRNFLIGRKVTLMDGNSPQRVQILDVDDDCALRIKASNGSECRLQSESFRIRL